MVRKEKKIMNTNKLKKVTDIYPDFFKRLEEGMKGQEDAIDFQNINLDFGKDEPINVGLANQLLNQGIDPNGLTRIQAEIFLEYLKRPSWKQSATRAQQYALRKIGEFSEEEIKTMNKKRASKYIDRAIKNGLYQPRS